MKNRSNSVTKKPNIVWIVLDCARFDRVSAHGYERSTTPYLDRMIATGLDYTQAYSAAIWSLPSYTTLLTGLYPRQHGVNSSQNFLPEQVNTLAQQLQQNNFATACFSNNAWLSPTCGIHRGFEHFNTTWYSAQKSLWRKADFLFDKAWGWLRSEADKGARRTNRKVLQWLRSKRGQPCFTFIAYVEPHAPHNLYPKTVWELGKELSPTIKRGIRSSIWVESLPARHQFSEETLTEINLRYDVEMCYIDTQVGLLIEQLKNEDLFDNTIFIITADHGELLGEHQMLGHQFSVHEALRHVPLIIWAPAFWSTQETIHDLVQTVDISNTLCHWLNIPWQGTEFTHRLPERNTSGTRSFTVTDYPEPYMEAVRRRYPQVDLSSIEVGLSCISDQQFKVVKTSTNHWSGFDLATDPGEKLPFPVQQHERCKELQISLEQWLERMPVMKNQQVEIPEALVAHLKALGYMG